MTKHEVAYFSMSYPLSFRHNKFRKSSAESSVRSKLPERPQTLRAPTTEQKTLQVDKHTAANLHPIKQASKRVNGQMRSGQWIYSDALFLPIPNSEMFSVESSVRNKPREPKRRYTAPTTEQKTLPVNERTVTAFLPIQASE
jgi:hypothetical protein